MIVQWCMRDLSFATDDDALAVIDERTGLLCNWWRAVGAITPDRVEKKLAYDNLDRHPDKFDDPGLDDGMELPA